MINDIFTKNKITAFCLTFFVMMLSLTLSHTISHIIYDNTDLVSSLKEIIKIDEIEYVKAILLGIIINKLSNVRKIIYQIIILIIISGTLYIAKDYIGIDLIKTSITFMIFYFSILLSSNKIIENLWFNRKDSILFFLLSRIIEFGLCFNLYFHSWAFARSYDFLIIFTIFNVLFIFLFTLFLTAPIRLVKSNIVKKENKSIKNVSIFIALITTLSLYSMMTMNYKDGVFTYSTIGLIMQFFVSTIFMFNVYIMLFLSALSIVLIKISYNFNYYYTPKNNFKDFIKYFKNNKSCLDAYFYIYQVIQDEEFINKIKEKVLEKTNTNNELLLISKIIMYLKYGNKETIQKKINKDFLINRLLELDEIVLSKKIKDTMLEVIVNESKEYIEIMIENLEPIKSSIYYKRYLQLYLIRNINNEKIKKFIKNNINAIRFSNLQDFNQEKNINILKQLSIKTVKIEKLNRHKKIKNKKELKEYDKKDIIKLFMHRQKLLHFKKHIDEKKIKIETKEDYIYLNIINDTFIFKYKKNNKWIISKKSLNDLI